MTLYNGITSQVLVNGNVTELIIHSKGVRQGDPLSPLLYVVCIQLLLAALNKPNIEGIKIDGVTHKINNTAYADDLCQVFGSVEEFKDVLSVFNTYEKASGAILNTNKTVVMTCGIDSSLFEGFQTETHAKYLGCFIGVDDDPYERSWSDVTQKISSVARMWGRFQLSLNSKAQVVNRYLLPIASYQLYNLPCSETTIKSITGLLRKFLWNKNIGDVKWTTCCLPRRKGGLGINDPVIVKNCYRIKWIQRLCRGLPSSWTSWKELASILVDESSKNLNHGLWSFALAHNRPVCSSLFWKEALVACKMFGVRIEFDSIIEPTTILQLPLFNNPLIGNLCKYKWSKFVNAGVLRVADIFYYEDGWTSKHKLQKDYGIKVKDVKVGDIVNRIPVEWKIILENTDYNNWNCYWLTKLRGNNVAIKERYSDQLATWFPNMYYTADTERSIAVEAKYWRPVLKSNIKWVLADTTFDPETLYIGKRKLMIITSSQLKQHLVKDVTRRVNTRYSKFVPDKLQDVWWKHCHNGLWTGEKARSVNFQAINPLCYHCGQLETSRHLFYECEKAKEAIKLLKTWLPSIRLSPSKILNGNKKKKKKKKKKKTFVRASAPPE